MSHLSTYPIITENSELQSSKMELHFHYVSDGKEFIHWEYCPNPRLVLEKATKKENRC